MKFTFNGKNYLIEFERHGGVVPGRFLTIDVEQDDPNDPSKTIMVSKDVPIPTRHPYTTVKLWQVPDDASQPPARFRSATVGAFHREKRFTLETGRISALTALMVGSFDMGQLNERGQPTTLNQASRAFRRALWEAYRNRPRPISVPKDKPVEPDVPVVEQA